MKRQTIRTFLLLISFAFFPLTVVYMAPAPPLMSLKAGVLNLSVLTILAIVGSGFFLRRAFCGWICPGGGCQMVAKALNDQRFKQQKTNWFRVGLVVVWTIAVVVTLILGNQVPALDVTHPGAGKFATADIRFFLPYIPVVIFMFLFVKLFGRRGFCQRGCWIYPLVATSTRIGTWMRTPSLHVAAKAPGACVDCKACTKKCPMSIDVYQRVKDGSVLPNNCIQCGMCVDKCPKEVLGFAFGIEKLRRPADEAQPVLKGELI